MSDLKEIETRVASLKAKVSKQQGGPAGTKPEPAVRSLKKRLRRAQRKRRALVAFESSMAKKQKGKKESAAPESKGEKEAGA